MINNIKLLVIFHDGPGRVAIVFNSDKQASGDVKDQF